MAENKKISPTTPKVPLGGDYWEGDPGTDLWGFADLHAHLMAHLAFGGKAFWGKPYDPEHPGAEGIEFALNSCEPVHGGLININPEFGHPAGGGWPEFIIWPRFTTLIHQQAYIDWLYRAYQGGLRLITCLAVNNELLAMKTSPNLPHDDKNAIEVQIAAMKEMAAFIESQSGGPGKGWLQIAYSPEEARKIIGENRLAVILGVEVELAGKLAQLRRTGQAQPWRHQRGAPIDRPGAGLAARTGRAPDHADPPDQQCLRRDGDLHAVPGDGEPIPERRTLVSGRPLGDRGALPDGCGQRRRSRRFRTHRSDLRAAPAFHAPGHADRPDPRRARPVRSHRSADPAGRACQHAAVSASSEPWCWKN